LYSVHHSSFRVQHLNHEELVQEFSLELSIVSPAVFNFQENDPRLWVDEKAMSINAEYIRTMPIEELFPLVKAELRSNKLWREEYDDDDREWFVKAVDLIRQRYHTLKDFSAQGRAYFSDDFDFDEAALSKNLRKEPALKELLPALASHLEETEPFNAETAEVTLRKFAEEKGVKAGLLIDGSRTMLTGQSVGPSIFEVFDILGQKRSVERLRSGVPWFQAMNELGDT
jgi:glutamyl-tRNA synthetase